MTSLEFFSQSMFAKTIISELTWNDLRCNDCKGELVIEIDNDFECIKKCNACGKKFMYIKKLRDVE